MQVNSYESLSIHVNFSFIQRNTSFLCYSTILLFAKIGLSQYFFAGNFASENLNLTQAGVY